MTSLLEQKTYFSAETHEDANRLRTVAGELSAAENDLTIARKELESAELSGDRAGLVSANRAVQECEMIVTALTRQKSVLSRVLTDAICSDTHSASRRARAADMHRTQAGMSAMRSHLADAAEAVQRARESFVQAAGGSDLISDMTLIAERKGLVKGLPDDLLRDIPQPAVIGPRHLLPASVTSIEQAINGLLNS